MEHLFGDDFAWLFEQNLSSVDFAGGRKIGGQLIAANEINLANPVKNNLE